MFDFKLEKNKYIVTIDGQEKEIKIDKNEIDKSMKALDLDEYEAIEMYLEDEEYLINDEQVAATKKAKDNRVTATIHGAREVVTTERKSVKKENPTKEKVIQWVAEMLKDKGVAASITNISKVIEFDLDGQSYKLDLIQRRKK